MGSSTSSIAPLWRATPVPFGQAEHAVARVNYLQDAPAEVVVVRAERSDRLTKLVPTANHLRSIENRNRDFVIDDVGVYRLKPRSQSPASKARCRPRMTSTFCYDIGYPGHPHLVLTWPGARFKGSSRLSDDESVSAGRCSDGEGLLVYRRCRFAAPSPNHAACKATLKRAVTDVDQLLQAHLDWVATKSI